MGSFFSCQPDLVSADEFPFPWRLGEPKLLRKYRNSLAEWLNPYFKKQKDVLSQALQCTQPTL